MQFNLIMTEYLIFIVQNVLISRLPLTKLIGVLVCTCRWRRQTRLRQVGASGGLRGDVYYFAPCGKKLRTYPEVTRVSMRSI